MSIWNPWRGCHRYSDGCKYCYIHKGDTKRNIDTDNIVKTKDYDKPILKLKNGNYKMKAGLCYLCFQSDFLLQDADDWRSECWKMIKERQDCEFLFLTKRIERIASCLPLDWGDGYPNVTICCTIENQEAALKRLPIFCDLKAKHKQITAQPLIEKITIEKYLTGIECVVVGGESDKNGRILDYDWVLSIRDECLRNNVPFVFRQCATNFLKDGKLYHIPTNMLCKQARLANINKTN